MQRYVPNLYRSHAQCLPLNLLSPWANLALALRCHRVPRLHLGHVEEVAPESLRRESRCRQKVSRLWTFYGTVGPMEGQALQLACKLL